MSNITPTQDRALTNLAQRTVGFLVQIDEGGVRYLTPAGSGTIVSLKGVVFLLTAGHVTKAIMDSPLAGIYGVKAAGKAVRPVEFKPTLCAPIIHWDGTVSADGPDIAAIKLPPDTTAAVEHNFIVYNLDRRVALKDQMQPMSDLILAGYPSTATAKNVSMDEWQRRDMMSIHVNAGHRSPAVRMLVASTDSSSRASTSKASRHRHSKASAGAVFGH